MRVITGKRSVSPKTLGLIALALGVILAFAKLGAQAPEPDAPPVQAHALHKARGLVTVRGHIEYLRHSGNGLTLQVRGADGTPFTAYVGPDAVSEPLSIRQSVSLVGRMNGDLFLVSAFQKENILSESRTYPIAYLRNGWAYVQQGTGVRRFPVGPGWQKDTVTVSYYGGKMVVE